MREGWSERLYARNTVLTSLPPGDARSFLKDNHRQGSGANKKNRNYLGLTSQGELVAVAAFGSPSTPSKARRYDTELHRLAFKENTQVVGGASKLIKGYIRDYKPISLFTYQKDSEFNTNVYEHAGMTLVSKATPKKVLVKDGKTFSNAENNRHDWFSIDQVVRFGPDALLGTSLGEVFDKDGTRFSNIQLFQEIGYHLEEVPGDHVYEWINPEVTHYVYRITSTVDEGYYIGRHSPKKKMTKEQCLGDGYYGSGGKKYQNWVSKVGAENLQKEILGIYSTREEMIQAEEDLIGEDYKLPECKNTVKGGLGLSAYGFPPISVKACPVHGETKFMKNSCFKCAFEKVSKELLCPKHGLTLHKGSSCNRCAALKAVSPQYCQKHGETKFRGNSCFKCVSEKVSKELLCPKHGLTLHKGSSCNRCSGEKAVSLKHCETHGESSHNGKNCLKCQQEVSTTMGECPFHGHTAHQGETCYLCLAELSNRKEECPIHGLTWHKGKSCNRCAGEKAIKMKSCPKHGMVLHNGENCLTCQAEGVNQIKRCPVHGNSYHFGEDCRKCSVEKVNHKEECPIHGLTWHKGKSCNRCAGAKAIKMKSCPKHGITQHNGNSCLTCQNNAIITMKSCLVHGDTKFKGKSCVKCISEKRSKKLLEERITLLKSHGMTAEWLEKNLATSSQTKLLNKINETLGEKVFSQPYLRKVLTELNVSPSIPKKELRSK